MTDLARNTRTLIVCFSLAIFALIPLRFVEISQEVSEDYGGASVLGEAQMLEEPEVALPSADEYVSGELEAPYDEMDNGEVSGVTDGAECMPEEHVSEAVARVNEGLSTGLYADSEQAYAEIQWLNDQLCRE
ncbi:MAG: hypothetical protein WC841_04460 [Candidatus Shapirobacteria bacterium]|jgi:hypothetical protein